MIPKTTFIKDYTYIAKLLFLLLFSGSIYGQEIVELKNHLNQTKTSRNSSISQESKYLKGLISDLNSSVIIKKGVINTYSKAPFIRTDIDALSINKLKESNPLFNDVELITIRIEKPEDLAISIDQSIINQFPKLKYVYFLCSFNCTSVQIENLVKSKNIRLKYFYLVSIPS
jgi:hypothetical protein